MAVSVTTITNISPQSVPVLIGSVDSASTSALSDVAATIARQFTIPAGTQLKVETSRLDLGQLQQLANKKLITYTSS